MWIGRLLVEQIVDWCDQRFEYRRFGYLFLLAYTFLLRLPSEAAPASKGKGVGASRVYLEDDCLVLKLQRRQGLLCSCGRIDLSARAAEQEEPTSRKPAHADLLVQTIEGWAACLCA